MQITILSRQLAGRVLKQAMDRFFNLLISGSVFLAYLVVFFFNIYLFSEVKADTTPITIGAFAIAATLSSLLYSWSRAVTNDDPFRAVILYAGERMTHGAVALLIASIIKYGARTIPPDALPATPWVIASIREIARLVGGLLFFIAALQAYVAMRLIHPLLFNRLRSDIEKRENFEGVLQRFREKGNLERTHMDEFEAPMKDVSPGRYFFMSPADLERSGTTEIGGGKTRRKRLSPSDFECHRTEDGAFLIAGACTLADGKQVRILDGTVEKSLIVCSSCWGGETFGTLVLLPVSRIVRSTAKVVGRDDDGVVLSVLEVVLK
jgi:hypothetical protein